MSSVLEIGDRVVISQRNALRACPRSSLFELCLFAEAGSTLAFAEEQAVRRGRDRARGRSLRAWKGAYGAGRGHGDAGSLLQPLRVGRDRPARADGRGGPDRIPALPRSPRKALISFDPELSAPPTSFTVPARRSTEVYRVASATGRLHSARGRTLPREEVKLQHIGSPAVRLEQARAGTARAVMLMEPFISLALKQGAHVLGSYFYRGVEVIAPNLEEAPARDVHRGHQPRRRRRQQRRPRRVSASGSPRARRRYRRTRASWRDDYYNYVHVAPFTEKRFQESYAWMKSWQLSDGRNAFDQLLVKR